MARMTDVLADLAPGQHGLVARRQLLAAGVTRNEIEVRLRRGEFRALHAGVFQAGPVAGPRSREMAAVLACDGVVSHRSAAAMRELVTAFTGPVDISVAPSRRVRRPGIRVHRSRLGRTEVETLDGVPVTTLSRTLFDLASVTTGRELERALAAAERMDVNLRRRLRVLLERHPARRGTRSLRSVLASGAPALTRSEAEERLLELIRSAGLPTPAFNVMLHGHEVDCYWRAARLVVEVDGYAWHGSQRAHVRDRQRDSALAAAGIQVVRLSWQQLTRERDRTLVQLAFAIARGRSTE
jgi:very-short-patch-repair endonuclease